MPAKTKTPPRAHARRSSRGHKDTTPRAAAAIRAIEDAAAVATWRGSVQGKSANRKTGATLTTYSHPATCPTTCPLYGGDRGPDGSRVDPGAECYAAAGYYTRRAWEGVRLTWSESLAKIRAARAPMARGNVAGDIIHAAGRIVRAAAVEWAAALSKDGTRPAWTYTHHAPTPENLATLAAMADAGTVVNLSASDPGEAFAMMAAHPGHPVATVTPGDSPRVIRDQDGRRIVQCPATLEGSGVTCLTCGGGLPLCARGDRDYAIGFPVHGAHAGKGEARMRAATARAAGVTP